MQKSLPARSTRSGEEQLLLLLARYAAAILLIVGGLEWLLGRTVSRMAAAPTLEGTPRSIVEGLGGLGQRMVSSAVLLAVLLFFSSVLLAGATFIRQRRTTDLAMALSLGLFGVVVVVHTLSPNLSWLNLILNGFALLCIWWLSLRAAYLRIGSASLRMGIVLVALAYTGWFYYVLQQDVVNLGMSDLGSPVLVLNLGEIAAVAAPYAFFAATAIPHGQWRYPLRWIAPAMLAGAFSAGNIVDALFNQGFSGVFAIWSLGFNLFLPWPIYAISLLLFLYSVLTCFYARRSQAAEEANPNVGAGLLLLLYSGYTLQLPYQILIALIASTFFSGLASPFSPPHGLLSMPRSREELDATLPTAEAPGTVR